MCENIDRDIIQRCETFIDVALILGYGHVCWLTNKNGLTTTDGVYDGKKKQIRITDALLGKIHGTKGGKTNKAGSSATMRRDVERNKNMSYQTNTISRVNREIKR